MNVSLHGRATIYPTLEHHVCTSKKTGINYGVPSQSHARVHCRRILAVSKQCIRLSTSQEHEQLPQEKFFADINNQRIKGYGDGLCKQFLRRADVMDVRTVWSNRIRRPCAEPRRDTSDV